MTGVRPNASAPPMQGFNIPPRKGSTFNSQVAGLKPFAWWKLNDAPASGTVLDYGNTNGPLIPPAAPPHNLSLPAHLASVPGMTTDGATGLGWDGVNGAQMDNALAANNDLPQGTAWTLLFINKSSAGDGVQVLADICGGLGVDHDGKAHFIIYTGYGGVGDALAIQSFYEGGTNVVHSYTDPRVNDGHFHMYALNIYNGSPSVPAGIMTYDLYIDGQFSATTTLNTNGLSTWYGGANDASLPDGFHIGGYSSNVGSTPRTKGQMQHVILWVGGYTSQFGGMLTAAQIFALYNGR